ncbi:hypothetical protein [Pseudacidobacterium ailaaui]|uniref:hypothetical protein n=1 Tax=Pseudacidobacterium ailaaui TaxID=1382359 RepID=UPI00047B900F|nr:hypothetical protein [Pseudacidobacterium ailaaui]MDI3255161.1 hypothetical protein [Bacillota bacterium]
MDSFSLGLASMSSYIGNVLLPIVAGLIICMGVFAYSKRMNGERYIYAALACLLVSGFIRAAEQFVGSPDGSGSYEQGLLNLTNWLSNVIMPFYAVFCFARGVLSYSGVLDRTTVGEGWLRYVISGFACLTVSGILRLLENLVASGAGGIH